MTQPATTRRPDWTHRLGLLVPSVNTVVERDLRLSLPDPVSAHVARIPITRDTPEQLAALADAAPGATRLLAHAAVDSIVFACTSGSLYHGPGYDTAITERITEVAGVPASTTSTAVVAALRSLGLTRVLLVTPYEPWLDELVVAFLGAHDIEVTGTSGPALPDPLDTASVPPQAIADAVGDLGRAEGVFVSCTAFRGLEAAGILRERLGVPVVASNEATVWDGLRLAGRGPDAFPPDGYAALRR
ncbi:aspartate/glutamate racemase family protein [Micromonospora sp. WMMD882]|uniref:maleate cis-trans isomerase family protein n=1 Tax=Micromonospora sp. WMMD882 TaxID=3015151 RepID=UPI00248D28D2|nr:aspartate/glutamate racemase family protein [Micromonospora sp. WMMD882]WBB81490.1 aspartate/glutamate racemase family protein [Micromonospora sp. WMMD882]